MELNFEIDFDDLYWSRYYDGLMQRLTDTKCYILYFDDMIKIGSTNCIKRRIQQIHSKEVEGRRVNNYEFLETELPAPLLEVILHRRYKDKNVFKNEYFDLCIIDDLKNYIANTSFKEYTTPPNQYIHGLHYQGKIYWFGNDERLMGTIETIANKNHITNRTLIDRLKSGLSIFEALNDISTYARPTFKTLEECKTIALKYKKRIDLERADKTRYSYILKKEGWRDVCFAHMEIQFRWTKEACLEDASLYNTSHAWHTESHKAYDAAKRNGWYEDCIKHMSSEKLIKFTKEECLASTAGYTLKSPWLKQNYRYFNTADKNGWLDECVSLIWQNKQAIKHEQCRVDALKYNHRSDWQLGDDSATYQRAFKYKWLDDMCTHMVWKSK